MTPEQTHQMVILCNMILVEEPLLAIGAHVRAMLAAERAAVVAECANVCKRLAEAMEQGAGELAPGGRLRQAENTIRDLGEKRE